MLRLTDGIIYRVYCFWNLSEKNAMEWKQLLDWEKGKKRKKIENQKTVELNRKYKNDKNE